MRRHASEPQRVRAELSALNDAAAKSRQVRDAISAGCTVISMGADGSGFQELAKEGPIDTRYVMSGMTVDLSKVAGDVGMTKGRVVGASFGVGGPDFPVPPPSFHAGL